MNIQIDELITEYNALLLGQPTQLSTIFRNDKTYHSRELEQRACAILRYAIDYILRWSPKDAMELLTPEILEKLKLTSIVKKISIPPDKTKNPMRYYLSLCYPKQIKYPLQESTLEIYQEVIDGSMSKFPRGFFTDRDAIDRMIICFRFYVQENIHFETPYDMYKFFGTSDSTEFMNRAHLHASARKIGFSTLQLMSQSIPAENRKRLWFDYFTFKSQVDSIWPKFDVKSVIFPIPDEEGTEQENV